MFEDVAEEKTFNGKRVAALVGILLIAAMPIAFAWWFNSPARSLAKIRDAYREHDLEEFEKRVDVDGVTKYAVNDMVSAMGSDMPSGAGGDLAKGLLAGFSTIAAAQSAAELRKSVETGSDDFKRNVVGKNGAVEFKKILRAEREGKLARVSVLFRDEAEKRDYVFRLSMRHKGFGHWQLFRVDNLGEFFKEASERQKAERQKAEEAARIQAEQQRIADEEQDRLRRVQAGETILPATSRLPRRELRTVQKIVGYKEEKWETPGQVYFDRATMTFHIKGCPYIATGMISANHSVLTNQGVTKDPDCASRPLPYEKGSRQVPITVTANEWVDVPGVP